MADVLTYESPTQQEDQTAISLRNVQRVYRAAGEGATHALAGVTLDIRHNEFFTLLGPSGCGKTTLLRLLAGFEAPTAGDILLFDQPMTDLPPFRRPVNTVFQSYALFPHLTVAQNVAFALEMLGWTEAERQARVTEALAMVRLSGMERRKPAQLSGGQQQRVALARALAPRPKLLLLDEPLSALDLKLRKEMQLELKQLQRETGITFVFVTHDQEEALTMSDRIAVMRSGSVLQVGTPREIYQEPACRFVAEFIGDTNLIEAGVVADGAAPTLRTDSGRTLNLPVQGLAAGSRVTLAVRPEQARLVPANEGWPATIRNVVYFGTDTNFHLTLDGDIPFVVRVQNSESDSGRHKVGDRVGVAVAPGAWRVLDD